MPLDFEMWRFLITVYISGKIFSSVFNLKNGIFVLLHSTKKASLFFASAKSSRLR